MNYHLQTLLGVSLLWNLFYTVSNAALVFQCDFEWNTCGFFNDEGHEAKWVRKRLNLADVTSTVMVVEIGPHKMQMARLLSPILDQHWSNTEGCLSLELYTAGDGIAAFRVKTQDDSGVLPLLGVHTEVQDWRKYDLHVDVADYIRFIIEADVDPNRGGTLVAIDNVSFSMGDCKAYTLRNSTQRM